MLNSGFRCHCGASCPILGKLNWSKSRRTPHRVDSCLYGTRGRRHTSGYHVKSVAQQKDCASRQSYQVEGEETT